jgi:hypothetical protein
MLSKAFGIRETFLLSHKVVKSSGALLEVIIFILIVVRVSEEGAVSDTKYFDFVVSCLDYFSDVISPDIQC